MTINHLANAIKSYGYKMNSRPFEINLIGVRSSNAQPNSFDDTLHVFYNNGRGQWVLHSFPCTTDPGTYWLKNPIVSKGTAILKAGQYAGAYEIGIHRGKYKALVQRGPLNIVRDYNRDNRIDLNSLKSETGNNFGINIHRANASGTTKTVDRYSAGCQVLANATDFTFLMQLAEIHRKLYGNKFTYTLFDESSIPPELLKNG
jgi:hypothetical protein